MSAGKANLIIEQGADFSKVLTYSSEGDSTKDQGLWDANANSPAIPTAASGNKDQWYTVSVAGSTTIDGVTSWKVGDIIVSNGSAWYKNEYPIDLTGYTARMQIRASVADTAKIEDMTTENGKISITAATGKITLTLTDTVTGAYTFGSAVYDIELIDASGNVERLLEGSVTLDKEVTR